MVCMHSALRYCIVAPGCQLPEKESAKAEVVLCMFCSSWEDMLIVHE